VSRVIAIVALSALCVLVVSSPARPSRSDTIASLKGHILFTRAGGLYGDETVFVANADGTGQRRLTKFNGGCCPFATPTGSVIEFVVSLGNRLTAVTARLDGSHRHVLQLPKGTVNLAGGPITRNGKVIAVEGFDDAHPALNGIYLRRASDGKVIARVIRKHVLPGDFSPDGKRLVFFSGPNGDPPPPGGMWIIDTTGTGLRRITPSRVKVQCCISERWSPDGRKILFADVAGVIWTIAPDGSELTRVFKDTEGRYATTPTWSPDGSMIMFALDPTPDPFQHPRNGLYVIRADGTDLTQVIGGQDFKREPFWVSG
jgi:Tol biopolymer transport system component